MDEPASDPSDERDTLDRLIALLGPRFDDARSLLEGATSRWRGDATRGGGDDEATACRTSRASSAS